jgi:hypothetical protein
MAGATHRQEPAIFAWKFFDPTVELSQVDVGPTDGVFWVGAKVTDNGDGTWHYEYAIHNLNSDRSARAFRVPVINGTEVIHIGFRDINYHSGEPQSPTDWNRILDTSTTPHNVLWETTETFAENVNANALRWGTTYNFRFDANVPPTSGPATIELFKPGTPASVVVTTLVPVMCNSNGECDLGEPACDCPGDCPPPLAELACGDAIDEDCDGLMDCLDGDCCLTEGGGACDTFDQDADSAGICIDCNDQNNTLWSVPSEAQEEFWTHSGSNYLLQWYAPVQPGGTTALSYEVLRSSTIEGFAEPTCIVASNPTVLRVADNTVPPSGGHYNYLVRAINGCGAGETGAGSDGTPRTVGECD